MDMLIGIGIGFVIAIILFSGQNVLGQLTRQSPLGCLIGIICICIGLVLLILAGHLRISA
jgi:hypothetical protein